MSVKENNTLYFRANSSPVTPREDHERRSDPSPWASQKRVCERVLACPCASASCSHRGNASCDSVSVCMLTQAYILMPKYNYKNTILS